MTVTFCGHSDFCNDEIKVRIYENVEKLILNGADKFLLGGYGSFDVIVARTIKKIKIKYPYVKSYLVIPYLNRNYETAYYDGTIYPPIETVPLRFAITARNKWMINNSDILISYVRKEYGGAYSTFCYAKTKKVIIEL